MLKWKTCSQRIPLHRFKNFWTREKTHTQFEQIKAVNSSVINCWLHIERRVRMHDAFRYCTLNIRYCAWWTRNIVMVLTGDFNSRTESRTPRSMHLLWSSHNKNCFLKKKKSNRQKNQPTKKTMESDELRVLPV